MSKEKGKVSKFASGELSMTSSRPADPLLRGIGLMSRQRLDQARQARKELADVISSINGLQSIQNPTDFDDTRLVELHSERSELKVAASLFNDEVRLVGCVALATFAE